jgi:hypothetical protein
MNKIKQFWHQIIFFFWKLIWHWKHKSGFIDLGKDIEVVGTILWTDYGNNTDGDFTFNLKLDPEYSWANLAFGRHTSEDPVNYPDTLHCEIVTWMRAQFANELPKIKLGVRVKISGRWGFDGVHTGRAEWIEVVLALIRHQPNVSQGWLELHPVGKIEFI